MNDDSHIGSKEIALIKVKNFFRETHSQSESEFEREWKKFLMFLGRDYDSINSDFSIEEIEKVISTPIRNPYYEGWEYGHYGDEPENPYPENSSEFEEWQRGYKDGLYEQ